MTRMGRREREARDAAFAEMLAGLNSGYAVRREIVGARKRAGMTQEELARRMRTTQSVIARWELGGRSPSVKTLQKVAEVTGSRLVVRLEGEDG